MFKSFYKKHKKAIKIFIVLFVLAILCWISVLSVPQENIEALSYIEFEKKVNNNEVDLVVYSPQEETMLVYLYTDETRGLTLEEKEDYNYSDAPHFKCLYPANEDFRKDLLLKGVTVKLKGSSTSSLIVSLLSSLLVPLLFLGLMWFMLRKVTPVIDGARTEDLVQYSNVTFDSIIGLDETIDDLRFIIDFLRSPVNGEQLGLKLPKGILLSGEPGTGKTLLAKAVAGEAKVPFLYMNASGFTEMYVGLGAKRVRNLFKIARESAPCIVFLDEIDAIGGSRDSRTSHSENNQTIGALLQEMDGFNSSNGIFILAATNRPDSLDKALTRAGRFDRQVIVQPPRDWKVRKELFEFYLKDFGLSDDVNLEALSKQTSGFTGSDIATVCNEAGLIAYSKVSKTILPAHNVTSVRVDLSCIEEAIDKRVFKGNRSKKERYASDVSVVAYHEAGHAVMTFLRNKPIARVSIIGTTSGVGGFVMQSETPSQFVTKEDIETQIMILYAGRCSEVIKFGENGVTTGASSDIAKATELIRNYIAKLSFNTEQLGVLDLDVLAKECSILNETDLLHYYSDLSKGLYADTLSLLEQNYALVERLVVKLLDVETMYGEDVENLLEEVSNGK